MFCGSERSFPASFHKNFRAGKWKLKLESRAAEETATLVTAFIDYNSTAFSGATNK